MYITGEFICPFCGFTYSQRWHPKKEMKDKVMIKSMGHLWIKNVLELYVDGLSVGEISKKMNTSNFGVSQNLKRIIGYDKKLNTDEEKEKVRGFIQAYLETAIAKEAEDSLMKKTYEYRKSLLETISKFHLNTRMEIIKAVTKEYNWLKMHDLIWLEANIPPSIEVTKKAIDFSLFDQELSQRIQCIADELYNNYSYQIYRTTILKKLSKTERARLQSMYSRLPKSMDVLEENIEDVNKYLIRRLPRAINILRKKGYRNITFESLSNYNPKFRNADEETKNKIDDFLKMS